MAVDVGLRITAQNRATQALRSVIRSLRGIDTATDDASAASRKLRADFAQLQKTTRATERELENVRKELDDLRTSSNRAAPPLRDVSGALQTVGFGATAVAVATGALTKSFLDAAVRMEGYRNGLIAIEGSAEAASETLKDVIELAGLPGVELQAANRAIVRLKTVGFSADLAKRAITEFGNALALVGESDLGGAFLGLEQILSSGRVQQQELNQILERSGVFAKALQDAFGSIKSEPIQAELDAAGESVVDFAERFITSLEKVDRLPLDSAINTIKNLQNEIFLLQAALGETLLPTFTGLTRTLTSVVQAVNNLSTAQKQIIAFGTASTAALATLTAALAGAAFAITQIRTLLLSFGIAGGPVALAIAGVSALAGVMFLLAGRTKDANAQLRENLKLDTLRQEFEQTQKTIETLIFTLEKLGDTDLALSNIEVQQARGTLTERQSELQRTLAEQQRIGEQALAALRADLERTEQEVLERYGAITYQVIGETGRIVNELRAPVAAAQRAIFEAQDNIAAATAETRRQLSAVNEALGLLPEQAEKVTAEPVRNLALELARLKANAEDAATALNALRVDPQRGLDPARILQSLADAQAALTAQYAPQLAELDKRIAREKAGTDALNKLQVQRFETAREYAQKRTELESQATDLLQREATRQQQILETQSQALRDATAAREALAETQRNIVTDAAVERFEDTDLSDTPRAAFENRFQTARAAIQSQFQAQLAEQNAALANTETYSAAYYAQLEGILETQQRFQTAITTLQTAYTDALETEADRRSQRAQRALQEQQRRNAEALRLEAERTQAQFDLIQQRRQFAAHAAERALGNISADPTTGIDLDRARAIYMRARALAAENIGQQILFIDQLIAAEESGTSEYLRLTAEKEAAIDQLKQSLEGLEDTYRGLQQEQSDFLRDLGRDLQIPPAFREPEFQPSQDQQRIAQGLGTAIGRLPGDIGGAAVEAFLTLPRERAQAVRDLQEETLQSIREVNANEILSAREKAEQITEIERQAASERSRIFMAVADAQKQAFQDVVVNFVAGIGRMIAAEIQLQIARRVTQLLFASLAGGSSLIGAAAGALGPAGLAIAGIAGIATLFSGTSVNVGGDLRRLASFSFDDPLNDAIARQAGRQTSHRITERQARTLGRNSATDLVNEFRRGFEDAALDSGTPAAETGDSMLNATFDIQLNVDGKRLYTQISQQTQKLKRRNIL